MPILLFGQAGTLQHKNTCSRFTAARYLTVIFFNDRLRINTGMLIFFFGTSSGMLRVCYGGYRRTPEQKQKHSLRKPSHFGGNTAAACAVLLFIVSPCADWCCCTRCSGTARLSPVNRCGGSFRNCRRSNCKPVLKSNGMEKMKRESLADCQEKQALWQVATGEGSIKKLSQVFFL